MCIRDSDYDRQDRISVTWFYSAAEKAEKKLYSYVYNKQGELARVTDQTLGKTYWLYYDFLGRLMRVVDMKDSCSYAVSYTHLDVYKRQGMYRRSEFFCSEASS